jgi:hypothetical protein
MAPGMVATIMFTVPSVVPFKDMSAIYPALRMARCQHHYVFCLPQEDAPALIVAILHERMDLMKRLADRLNG